MQCTAKMTVDEYMNVTFIKNFKVKCFQIGFILPNLPSSSVPKSFCYDLTLPFMIVLNGIYTRNYVSNYKLLKLCEEHKRLRKTSNINLYK